MDRAAIHACPRRRSGAVAYPTPRSFHRRRSSIMNGLSYRLAQALASAVVTAAALSGNAFAATCAGAPCAPRAGAAKCGACKARGATAAHKARAKAKGAAKR
ncbi:MAG: hypothetical protein KGL18_02485 [Burkholderiales bacterium]|nr:hypothetical protein [Burkholderiales bacterium]MDE2501835.1 hypothetical protein [Burkholderiales bacterium]